MAQWRGQALAKPLGRGVVSGWGGEGAVESQLILLCVCVLIRLKRWDFHNNQFRQAVQNFLCKQSAIMDSLKVYDTQFSHRDNKSILAFLDKKHKSLSAEHSTEGSVDSASEDRCDKLVPRFSFVFGTYSIGEHVEYNVTLVEKYKILGRTITKSYPFRTRYSKLQVLDKKLGGMGLPGKKFFGNKDPSFIQKRKVELQAYLNKLARSDQPEFFRFIKQIKDCQFNLSLKQTFSIE